MPSKILTGIANSYRAALSLDYATRLHTSWLLPPLALAILRALISVYAFATLFTALAYQSLNGRRQTAEQSFSFFTVLGYWGIAFYTAFAAAHGFAYWARGRTWLEGWWGGLRWLMSGFYATVTVFPFVVTAVFWAVLASGALDGPYSSWSNISQHALNSVFAFVEIALPRSLPHPWINVALLVVLLACYLGLAYVTQATQGFYVYPFLNSDNGNGLVAGACIGVLVGTIIVFVIVRYVIWLRLWVTEEKLSMTGKLSSRHASARGRAFEDRREEMATVEKPR